MWLVRLACLLLRPCFVTLAADLLLSVCGGEISGQITADLTLSKQIGPATPSALPRADEQLPAMSELLIDPPMSPEQTASLLYCPTTGLLARSQI